MIILAYVDSFSIPAHPSIYVERAKERSLEIHYAIPDSGIDAQTKMIVFAAGFGGHSKSNVYQKMRAQFADRYNCVTLQCDYFGSIFMQGATQFEVTRQTEYEMQKHFSKGDLHSIRNNQSNLLQVMQNYSSHFTVRAVHEKEETLNDFNDMGLMQAIDIITAIQALRLVLTENNMALVTEEIIGYGHSHGAYLLQLASIIEPNLFTHIIDNCAWTEPQYLKANRYLFSPYGKAILQIEFDYLAKTIPLLVQNLSVEKLWKSHQNRVNFIMYQGTNDNLIDHVYKQNFFQDKNHVVYREVSEKEVDGEIIKANTHGLEADFLKLFDQAYVEVERLSIQGAVEESNEVQIGEIRLQKDTTTPLTTYRLLNLSM